MKRRPAGDGINLGDADGHGRYGHLDHTEDGGLLCHECGRSVQHLATHARRSHGLDAATYRERHGLTRGQALVSAGVAEDMSRRSSARVGTRQWKRFEQARNPAAATAASLPGIAQPRRAGVRVKQAPAARAAGRGHRHVQVLTCVICGAQWCPLNGGLRNRATCTARACLREHRARERDRRRQPDSHR